MTRKVVTAIAAVVLITACSGKSWQHDKPSRSFVADHSFCAKQATSIMGLPPVWPHDLDRSRKAIRARFAYIDYAHEHALYVEKCLDEIGWEYTEEGE